jgi:shikimate dehydrogenase
MHNAALRHLGLDAVYLALPVPAARLEVVVEALEAVGCRGLNVTLPHKRAAAGLARRRSALAERLGAVNTLVPLAEGGWYGTNTDVEGFLAPLGPWPSGGSALVLGCGGSALAVVAGLAELGVGRVQVAARRADRLEAFLATCRPWGVPLEGLVWQGDGTDEELSGALAEADLVVNTTPVGMAAADDPAATERSPLTAGQLARLRQGCTVYDLIYTPRPTALLRQAEERSCRTVDGLEMLVQQGAASLRLWSGQEEVPVEAMREAALAALAEPFRRAPGDP